MNATDHQYRDDSRAAMLSFVPALARRVLDVGCNKGGFGAALKLQRPDVEVHGMEPSVEAAAVAAERLDGMTIGRFPDAMPAGSFDAITFLDVLEHMVDPLGAIEAARGLLTADGVVLASMPNVRHYTVAIPLLVGGRWDYKDEGILDRTHLRFFTKATMRELFEAGGYNVERMAAVATQRPKRPSPTWLALKFVGRDRRQELTTVQYGIRTRLNGS